MKVEGNLINRLMENNNTTPVVGQYANLILYMDRHSYLVHSYDPKKKVAVLEILHTTADTSKGPLTMGHQSWKHEQTGEFITVKYRHGNWKLFNSNRILKLSFTEKPDYYYCWEF